MQKAVEKETKINFEIATITPEIAAAWLDANVKNRKLQQRLVTRLAHDMRKGNFDFTGDTIKFDRNNKLIDGQHRLRACVLSNTPFEAIVVYGLDPQAQNVIDTGKARTKGDMLALQGITNWTNTASAYRFLFNYKYGVSPLSNVITHSDMLDCLERHPKLYMYVPTPGAIVKGIPTGMIGFVNYAAATVMKKKDRADAMMGVLKTGSPDFKGDPIHLFRERVIAGKIDNRSQDWGDRNSFVYTFYHCWNLFAKGEPLSALHRKADEVQIEWLKTSQL